tara:strand:- start:149 stop:316 length:168 start_codon:yes stop_codon:yes gene_type:complete
MSLFVQSFIIDNRTLSVFPWRDTWRDASGAQAVPEPVGVVATIRQQMFGGGERLK